MGGLVAGPRGGRRRGRSRYADTSKDFSPRGFEPLGQAGGEHVDSFSRRLCSSFPAVGDVLVVEARDGGDQDVEDEEQRQSVPSLGRLSIEKRRLARIPSSNDV